MMILQDASPNLYAWKVYTGLVAFQLFLAFIIPGYKQEGLPVPSLGYKTLMYNCNALFSFYAHELLIYAFVFDARIVMNDFAFLREVESVSEDEVAVEPPREDVEELKGNVDVIRRCIKHTADFVSSPFVQLGEGAGDEEKKRAFESIQRVVQQLTVSTPTSSIAQEIRAQEENLEVCEQHLGLCKVPRIITM